MQLSLISQFPVRNLATSSRYYRSTEPKSALQFRLQLLLRMKWLTSETLLNAALDADMQWQLLVGVLEQLCSNRALSILTGYSVIWHQKKTFFLYYNYLGMYLKYKY